jgi:hypothetical protein
MPASTFVLRRPLFLFKLPRYLQTPFLLCILLSSVIALSLLVLYFSLQPVVPLFYSLAEPAEYLVAKEWLILFPIICFTVTFLHIMVIRSLFHYERIIPILFAWTTVVVESLLALAFFRIILLVT